MSETESLLIVLLHLCRRVYDEGHVAKLIVLTQEVDDFEPVAFRKNQIEDNEVGIAPRNRQFGLLCSEDAHQLHTMLLKRGRDHPREVRIVFDQKHKLPLLSRSRVNRGAKALGIEWLLHPAG